jgi:hypothetical protein
MLVIANYDPYTKKKSFHNKLGLFNYYVYIWTRTGEVGKHSSNIR